MKRLMNEVDAGRDRARSSCVVCRMCSLRMRWTLGATARVAVVLIGFLANTILTPPIKKGGRLARLRIG
jgi:hypothetical protein